MLETLNKGRLGGQLAAMAMGAEVGAEDMTIAETARHMARMRDESFKPIPENVDIYNKLYEEYSRLHDYFGCGGNPVMKRLKAIKAEAGRSTEAASTQS
ncbi:L-ribulokinase [Paenibacillus jamilae]|uniref:hypothetical protein n=1 Tax=Paenibacillus TaxID=44249 RepID=UPI001DCAE142|nr:MULTISPECIES: hypothetical protein [Paenibacillus]MBZ6442239.1 hypothetical protein [Paenibacillus polymyxa]MBZ6452933.1 hypothetical protein [Paenibacillus polymyxa]MDP9676716.1 L-ribulokinase [Paenibacillus jamilae]